MPEDIAEALGSNNALDNSKQGINPLGNSSSIYTREGDNIPVNRLGTMGGYTNFNNSKENNLQGSPLGYFTPRKKIEEKEEPPKVVEDISALAKFGKKLGAQLARPEVQMAFAQIGQALSRPGEFGHELGKAVKPAIKGRAYQSYQESGGQLGGGVLSPQERAQAYQDYLSRQAGPIGVEQQRLEKEGKAYQNWLARQLGPIQVGQEDIARRMSEEEAELLEEYGAERTEAGIEAQQAGTRLKGAQAAETEELLEPRIEGMKAENYYKRQMGKYYKVLPQLKKLETMQQIGVSEAERAETERELAEDVFKMALDHSEYTPEDLAKMREDQGVGALLTALSQGKTMTSEMKKVFRQSKEVLAKYMPNLIAPLLEEKKDKEKKDKDKLNLGE